MLHYLIGPAVGAVIGYITNDLAIRMLFRPHQAKYIMGVHVPFTPGIIPKEKARMAGAIGKAVSENLMNREVLEKSLLSDEMLTKIGAKNVCGDQKSWVSISIEDAVKMNPDVILTNVDYVEDPVKEIKALKGWENVKAVKNNEVYKVDANLSMQPNNHIVDAALEWVKDIYPDIFSDLSKSIEQALKDTVEKIKGIAGTSETTKAAA